MSDSDDNDDDIPRGALQSVLDYENDENNDSDDDDTSDDDDAVTQLSQMCTNTLYAVVTDIAPRDAIDTAIVDNIEDERGLLILDMAEHVREWKVQREFVRTKMEEAKLDLAQNIQWPYKRYVFVGDYCQNMGLPYFGNEQVGDTYYYSPLTIYIFGMTNYATEILNAYVYHEGEAAKGGNNVTSLVWKNFETEGIIKEWKESGKLPGESLTMVLIIAQARTRIGCCSVFHCT